ncbi:MAG: RNA-binding protein [Thermofilum sp.]|jgi:small nuclear ribonucleoprotein|nr:RNA-binding protein [Thermofilum sp.]MCC6059121.1 RNA-binding protein [Thermofilum sp.]
MGYTEVLGVEDLLSGAAGKSEEQMLNAVDLLSSSIGKSVLVKLKGGRELRGTLRGYDYHLNLVLENAEETRGTRTRQLGTIVVRGDNIVLISPAPE